MLKRLVSPTIILGMLAAFAYAAALYSAGPLPADVSTAPGVLVTVDDGHGSGVYIGGGRILTAGHVAAGLENVTITDEAGNVARAYVSWIDHDLDVAMLILLNDLPTRAAKYACIDPTIGNEIEAVGNPFDFRFVHTYGHVASLRMDLDATILAGAWPVAIAVDMIEIPGMSGGPVYNQQGIVVGIVVGMIRERGYSVSFIVPTAAVCDRLEPPPVA